MSEKYAVFVPNQPPLSLPVQETDALAVVRDGVTYRMPPTTFSASAYPPTYAVVSVITEQTVTMSVGLGAVILQPAADIGELHVILPASPTDKQIASISMVDFSVIAPFGIDVAAPGGATVLGAGPFTLYAGEGIAYRYSAATTTWYPVYSQGGTASLVKAQSFTGGQRGNSVEVVGAASVFTIDFNEAQHFYLTLDAGTGNSIAAPLNATGGQQGVITIVQADGSDTTTWDAAWLFAGGTPPTLSTGAGAIDVFPYVILDTGAISGPLIGDGILNVS